MTNNRRSYERMRNYSTFADFVQADCIKEPKQKLDASRCLSQLRQYCCSLDCLRRRLPIVSWLPKYTVDDLKGDFLAGTTVALTLIPQGLALASLAGLTSEYGLYTAFLGCFVYIFFGSCKDLTIGPTAIMSLMTGEHLLHAGNKVIYAVMLTFLSGCIQLAMGFLNLGILVDFISGPVVSGFTSAAAITIASSQLKDLFGIKISSTLFFDVLYEFFSKITQLRIGDTIMGLSCVGFLLIIKHFKDINFENNAQSSSAAHKLLAKIWWIFATGRNAFVVIVCTALSSILLTYDINVLTLTPDVPPGLPPFHLPDFSFDYNDTSKNITVHVSFSDIMQDLGTGIIVIPLLSVLEAVAIAKAFARGRKLDATQELFALGMCNLLGSFVSSYPVTGSFSRTAINHSSGVRTPMGGIFTGALVLLALGVLAPYFKFIPKASLAAIITVAVAFMVHTGDIIVMWRTNKWDFIPFLGTFISSFALGLEYGIMIGVGLSLIMLLYQSVKPSFDIVVKEISNQECYVLIRPDKSILFPAVEYLKDKICDAVFELSRKFAHVAVVFDGTCVSTADYTMAVGMKNLIESLQEEKIVTVFIHVKPSVWATLSGSNPSIFHHLLIEDEVHGIVTGLQEETIILDSSNETVTAPLGNASNNRAIVAPQSPHPMHNNRFAALGPQDLS